MTIHFACACGKTLKAPDNAAGKRARCPACAAVVPVPAPAVTADVTTQIPADEYDFKEPVMRAAPQRRTGLGLSSDIDDSGAPWRTSAPICSCGTSCPMQEYWRQRRA